MASVRAINVPGYGEIALGDWVDDYLWGTAEVDNGQTTDLQVFTSGRGQQKPGGSGTNSDFDVYVPEPGRMPTGWEMLVFAIGVEIDFAADLAEHQSLQGTLLHEFWILGKVYSQGHLAYYPLGGGISAAVATGNAVDFLAINNGVPAAGARKQYIVPHKIASGEAFFSKLRFPGGAPVLTASRNIAVVLSGLIKRSVQ